MTWIVGYGSLIWRPAFPAVEAVPGVLHGWERRFWQGSPDHRGTPDAPGRVVTVVPNEAASIGVVAYRLPGEGRDAILEALDHREQAGYRLESVRVALVDGRRVEGALYAAAPGNPSWLGPAPLEAMSAHIAGSHGPSGSNLEYLVELDDALVRLGHPDPHVRALRDALPAFARTARA
ncbi:MAG: gamma-glutamylcyclotransferase [Alphaproteobacteria bacterium]|nr:gamma-glutamylcyclotransferase [Alphaproteobacteria bacterium]